MIIAYMNGVLNDTERANLKWYWYTGKDQNTPLDAKAKSRNCHVKLMSSYSPPWIPISSPLRLIRS